MDALAEQARFLLPDQPVALACHLPQTRCVENLDMASALRWSQRHVCSGAKSTFAQASAKLLLGFSAARNRRPTSARDELTLLVG